MSVDPQSLTSRMLMQSHSAAHRGVKGEAVVQSYLAAFGVVKPYALSSKEMPPVFSAEYLPEWKAFVREFGQDSDMQAHRRALHVVLEFIRYMKHMGLNPFASSVRDPHIPAKTPTTKINSKFDVREAYQKLLVASLSDVADSLTTALRGTHLGLYFKSSRTKTVLKSTGTAATPRFNLVSSHVLVCRKSSQTMSAELFRLQGFLYQDRTIPAQLLEKYTTPPPRSRLKPKSTTPRETILLDTMSKLGWLVVLKAPPISAYIIRARGDKLVLRLEVAIEYDLMSKGPDVKRSILKAWEGVAPKFT